jgi:NADP-dependent 3-hydroxy acid dehydrogenase YdfG
MSRAKIESKLDVQPTSVNGKSIIVSGGTTGIGRATALLLAAEGARVLIYGRHEDALNDALSDIKDLGGEAYGMTADQAYEDDIRRVFEEADSRLGSLDILVNNAALAAKSVTGMSYDEWHYVVNANLVGYMACSELAIERMKRAGGGHIVNIGSMSSTVREEDADVYVATKAGIQAFSEALRKKVNKDNIKVSLIEPGLVGTNLASEAPGQEAKQEQQEANLEMLKAEDIAQCVLFCLMQPKRSDIVSLQVRPHKQMI